MIGYTFYQAKINSGSRAFFVVAPQPGAGSYNKEGDIVVSRAIANMRNKAQARLEESGRLAHDPGQAIESSSSDEAMVAGLKVASGLAFSSDAVSYPRVRFDFPEDQEAPANPLHSPRTKRRSKELSGALHATRRKRRAKELSGMQLSEKAKGVLRHSVADGIPHLLEGFHSHPLIGHPGLRVGIVGK